MADQAELAPIAVETEIQRIPFTASTLKTQELPISVFRRLQLQLSITHTNGTSAGITAESLLKSISNMRLVRDGNDTQIQSPLWPFFFMNQYDYHIAPQTSFFTTNTTQGNSTASVVLPFELTRSIAPEDTLLDLRANRKAVLEVNWGSSIGTNVTSLDSGFLKIYGDELVNSPAIPRARHEYSFTSQSLTLTGDNDIQLPVKGLNQYRRFWIFMRNSSAALSDSQANTFSLKSRSFTWMKKDGTQIKESNNLEYGIAPATGVYVIDPTRFGKMSRRLDARDLPELTLTINTPNGTGTVDILFEKAIYG